MLYKAEATPEEVEGYLQKSERIGYTTVRSESDEQKAKKNGWVNLPKQAEIQLRNIDRNRKIKGFLLSNWKFWITTGIALSAIYVTYLVSS